MTTPSRGERPPAEHEPGGDWVDRLLDDIAELPLVPEERLDMAVRVHGRTELSQPERLMLQALASGLDAKMIADAYGLSVNSVHQHLQKARYVLRAKNSTHAVTLAFRKGLIH